MSTLSINDVVSREERSIGLRLFACGKGKGAAVSGERALGGGRWALSLAARRAMAMF